MIAVGLLAISSAIAGVPQVTGDFDGDGKADTAGIVLQPDGRRDVVATFYDGRRVVIYPRVDEHAVLSVIPPVEIARLCEPFARPVPDCSRQFSHRDRDGLSFRPTAQEVPGLALWNGTRFSLQFSTWIPRAAPSVVAPPQAAQLPCKIEDQRGRLVEVNPRFCQAVTEYFKQPIQPDERSPHTALQVEIGESGKVEDCRVVESSGAPELDAKACSIVIEKARYRPGSAGGTIKRQTKRLRITWPKGGGRLTVSEG